jgi:hypothetical protein
MDSDFLWQFKLPCFIEESRSAEIKLLNKTRASWKHFSTPMDFSS